MNATKSRAKPIARNTHLYNQALELAPFMPFGSKVFATAVDRGGIQAHFFKGWLAGLTEQEKVDHMTAIDDALLVAATTDDGPTKITICNPKTPDDASKQVIFNIELLRKRFGGAQA